MAQMELQSGSHISLMSCTFDGVKHVSRGWEYAWKWYSDEVMHSKTRRCKLHVWWFLGGVGVEMHVRTIFPWLFAYAWFINLKKCTRMQNLAFVRTYTFMMKSTESFINETPGVSCLKMFYRYLHVCCLWLSYTDVQKSAYFKPNICSELNITSLILCRLSFPTWWTFGRWLLFYFLRYTLFLQL